MYLLTVFTPIMQNLFSSVISQTHMRFLILIEMGGKCSVLSSITNIVILNPNSVELHINEKSRRGDLLNKVTFA